MQIEEGMIFEGKVSGISKFGAFIELPEGKSGLVHISEISTEYVEDISNFLTKGQTVKVVVLSVGENGKITLSIRKAMAQKPKNTENKKPSVKPANYDWQKPKKTNEPINFEDMISKFKQSSDERIAGLKRNEASSHRPRRNSKPRK